MSLLTFFAQSLNQIADMPKRLLRRRATLNREWKREWKRERNRTRSKRMEPSYELFEARQLLTTFYLDPAGTFWIGGTQGDDTMLAEIVQSNVRFTINGTSQSKPVSQVNALVFLGRHGDDHMTNETSIPSEMYGGPGNDTLIGGFGDDVLVGNLGTDTMFGRAGNDIFYGSKDIDIMDGGDGDDRMYGGYGGKNTIRGGNGDDLIYAGDRGDEIWGGLGNDLILGGPGNDIIYGGPGTNVIRGNGGDDSLYAESGQSELIGGPGNDGLFLFGGPGGDNHLRPGPGKDRILIMGGQALPSSGNLSSEDVVIRFVNRSSSWTYKEIEAFDRGLRALHHRTGGTQILRDTTSSDPLVIAKYTKTDSAMMGAPGLNYHAVSVKVNPGGTHTATYTREIRMADFNENDSHEYSYAGVLLIHEISHSWDSNWEISRVVNRGAIWDQFAANSGWTTVNPGSSGYTPGGTPTQEVFEYVVSGGNITIPTRNWWYRNGVSFARSYGTENAKEDWGVTWEYIFFEEVYGASPSTFNYVNVPGKVAKVNELFSALS